jgi:hypothetical protein
MLLGIFSYCAVSFSINISASSPTLHMISPHSTSERTLRFRYHYQDHHRRVIGSLYS